MIVVGVIDVARLRVPGHRNQRNARAVAEEVERLDVARVVVAAALIGGDEDRGRRPQLFVRPYLADQVLDEHLVERRGRVGRMAGELLERAHEGDRRQRSAFNVGEERLVVLQLRLLGGIPHDADVAGERVADSAVGVKEQRNAVDRGEARVAAAVAAVVLPGHPMPCHHVRDRGIALRRQREVRGIDQVRRIAARLVPVHRVVVDEVVMAARAVGARHALLQQLRPHRAHAGRARVRAVHVGAAAVSVLGVVVVGAFDGIRVLDLVGEGHGGAAVEGHRIGEEGGIAGDDRLEVRARAAHRGLVVVVTAGVSVGERLEDRLIAGVRGPRGIGEGIHVVEAHGNRAFPGVEAAGRRRLAVGSRADRLFDPHELVVAAAIDVLPHLEEAVNGVTGVGGIGHVSADLERTVRQVGGEARVRHAARLAYRVRGVRLRQGRIFTG